MDCEASSGSRAPSCRVQTRRESIEPHYRASQQNLAHQFEEFIRVLGIVHHFTSHIGKAYRLMLFAAPCLLIQRQIEFQDVYNRLAAERGERG